MPAPVLPDDKRALPRSTLLFWAGVALAAIAALLLLVAEGNGTLRVAAVLALTSVVVIGLSVTLRPDDGAAVQELFDEIEELRAEIATVARASHQVAEQAHRAPAAVASVPQRGGEVAAVDRPGAGSGWGRVPPADEPEPVRAAVEPDGLRRWSEGPPDVPRRLDEASDGRRRPADPEGVRRPENPPGGRRRADDPGGGRRRQDDPGGGRRRLSEPEDEHVDRARRDDGDHDRYRARRRYEDGPDRFPAGRHEDGPDRDTWRRGEGRDAYPGRRHDDEEPRHRSRPAARYATERPASGVYGAPPRHDGHEARPGPEVPPRPLGVVRHTETVHVTTRHTIVDGAAPDPVPGNVYGRWTAAPQPEEQPWSASGPEPAARWEGYAPDPDRGGPSGTDPGRYPGRRPAPDDRSWPGQHPGHGRVYPAQDPGADHWSDVQAGDRWAAVRDDGHGRELRMGERRAAMHTDDTGTELRMEDRWSTVRRGDPRREHPESGPDRSTPDHSDQGGRWPEPHHALPPGGVPVPSAWRTPRQRQSVDDWPTPDGSPRGRGPESGADGPGHAPRGRDGGYPPREHDPRPPERWR